MLIADTFLPPGLGEPGADGDGHVAGAAVTARGAAGLADQSQAGGRGRGRAVQTGAGVNETEGFFNCEVMQYWFDAFLNF